MTLTEKGAKGEAEVRRVMRLSQGALSIPVAVLLMLSGCEQPESVEYSKTPSGDSAATAAALTFPHRTQLVDRQGRSLEVEITGRNSSEIRFTRINDGSEHVFSMSKLSPETQAALKSLPISQDALFEKASGAAKPTVSRFAERKKWLEGRIEDIRDEMSRKSLTTLQRKRFEKEIEELRTELLEIANE